MIDGRERGDAQASRARSGAGRARLLALAAAVLFSTGGAGIKVEAFEAAQVSALRSGIAALALLAWLRFRRRTHGGGRPWGAMSGDGGSGGGDRRAGIGDQGSVGDLGRGNGEAGSERSNRGAEGGGVHWSSASWGAGLVYAGTVTLFVMATKLTTAANAIFLQSTAPLYLLVLAPLLLHERFRQRDIVYLIGVAAGLVFCFFGQADAIATAPNPALGNLLGIASGVFWAGTLLALRALERNPRRAGTAMTAVVAGNAIACVGALPFALPLAAGSAGEWLTIGYLGVFQIGLAYICLTMAVRRLPALEVSLLLLLEPVLNPVWTWLIRGEQPGRWTVAGGAVIIGATAVKAIYDARPTAAAA